MTPANDNAQPFTISLSGPTRADLHGMIVRLQRELEPASAPRDWIVQHGDENVEGWPTATMRRRPRRPH